MIGCNRGMSSLPAVLMSIMVKLGVAAGAVSIGHRVCAGEQPSYGCAFQPKRCEAHGRAGIVGPATALIYHAAGEHWSDRPGWHPCVRCGQRGPGGGTDQSVILPRHRCAIPAGQKRSRQNHVLRRWRARLLRQTQQTWLDVAALQLCHDRWPVRPQRRLPSTQRPIHPQDHDPSQRYDRRANGSTTSRRNRVQAVQLQPDARAVVLKLPAYC